MEIKQIASALVKAQKEFGPPLKAKTNPAFRSKYADLGACIEAVIDGLNNNGIMLMQPCHEVESGVTVETIFIHESGEVYSAGKLHVPAVKQDPQGYGSALTYARRYSLMSACGIAPEDDDGNMASGNKAPNARTPSSAPKPTPSAPAKLNAQEIEHIKSLIDETASDLPAFMQWISKGAGYECKTLSDAPAGCYAHAIKQLKAKKANP